MWEKRKPLLRTAENEILLSVSRALPLMGSSCGNGLCACMLSHFSHLAFGFFVIPWIFLSLPFPSLSFYFLEDYVIHKAKYFAIIFTVFTSLPFHLKIYSLEKMVALSQGEDSCILSEFCYCQKIILISMNKFKD